MPVLPFLSSENKFQRKLDHTIITGLQSVVAADVAGDLTEVWSIEWQRYRPIPLSTPARTWSGEIHMVGKVERFRTELNRLPFLESGKSATRPYSVETHLGPSGCYSPDCRMYPAPARAKAERFDPTSAVFLAG